MAKEKVISLILCIVMIIMFACNNVVLADFEIQYKVEQITKIEDINSKNLYQYIFVYEDGEGNNHALAATLASNSNEMSSRSNHCSVRIEDNLITVWDEEHSNIVWNLTKSKKSVLESGENPVLQSASDINSDTKRNQIELSDNGGYPGIRFTDNGNGFSFVAVGNNKFKFYEK